LWLCFFDIAKIHVVAPLNSLLLSVRVSNGTLDVSHIEFVVVEESFGFALLSNLRLQQIG
jgi:hypothetical protein